MPNIPDYQIPSFRAGMVLEIKHKIPIFIGEINNLCGPDGTSNVSVNVAKSPLKCYPTEILLKDKAVFAYTFRHLTAWLCWYCVGREILLRFEA